MNNDTQYIRTHTYWMTRKEYKIWSKHRPSNVDINGNNNVITRTHIYFV